MSPRGREPQSERTPEERARAAAERAARRAGKPLPPAPEPEPVREPVRDPAPRIEKPRAAAPAPPPPAPEPVTPLPPARTRRRPEPVLPPRRTTAITDPHRPRWRARILAVSALLAVGVALYLLNETFQPFHGDARGAVRVTIPKNSDVGQIGEILEAKGVIESSRFFSLNATLSGRRGNLKPGDYTLPRDMSYGSALDALTQGPKAKVVPIVRVTIPEGLSRREIVSRLGDAELEGDYLKTTADAKFLRTARKLGAPKGTKSLEGFLFPATYDLVKGGTMADLVDKQLDAFTDNFSEVDLRTAKRRNLTRYDVLIIASMVEREATLDKERPLVSAVIHNRLREGIPLGIDATIRFYENNWSSPLKVSELERDSPYNTRLHRGLPPTPIGNPGLKSLQAAARPASVDYLFYVVKPGRCGEHAFSSTDAEFQKDVARYNSEREKAGGKSPTKC